MPQILLTQAIHPEAQRRLGALGTVAVAGDTGAESLRRLASDAEIIVVRAQLPDDIFDAAPRMLGAIRHGAGVDMIPIPQATAHGVLVSNVPGANAQSVAEQVVGTMVMLGRQLGAIERDLRAPTAGWMVARRRADHGHELRGSTLGIVGFGSVGRALARICETGFGMTVLTTNRTQIGTPPCMQPGPAVRVTQVGLDELLASSDWVVLTIALTDQTRGLIDARRLAQMKPGAFLINVARGAVLDEEALLDALNRGRLGGVALDVFWRQPLPPDHLLYSFDNAILTPHVAGISAPSMLRMGLGVVDAAASVLAGQCPPSLVNPAAWDAFVSRYLRREPAIAAAPPAAAAS